MSLLLSAKKPLIWSGMGTLMSEGTEELRELAELTEVPVYCTMPGKSGFDERHPLALGSGSGATGLHARRWIQESDVLLALGSSMTRTTYGQPIPDGKTILHNTDSIEDINKDFPVAVGLPGDARPRHPHAHRRGEGPAWRQRPQGADPGGRRDRRGEAAVDVRVDRHPALPTMCR